MAAPTAFFRRYFKINVLYVNPEVDMDRNLDRNVKLLREENEWTLSDRAELKWLFCRMLSAGDSPLASAFLHILSNGAKMALLDIPVTKIAFISLRRPLECLFLLGMFTVTLAATAQHPEYQTVGGWSCHMCPRGTFVSQDCTSDDPASTVCTNCSEGRFQPSEWTNERRCYRCDECDPGLDGSLGGEPLEECTIFQNAICRCPDEFYWSQPNRRCTAVTECPPGEGVTHTATIVADTECEPCRPQAFSATSSAEETCAPCLICEALQREVSPCNQTHDRVCQNISMPTGIPPTAKHPQEVSDSGGNQVNWVSIVAPVVAGLVLLILAMVVGFILHKKSKNPQVPNDVEGNIPRDNQELLDSSNSSTRSSSTGSREDASSPGSISTRGGDSLEYESEPGKSCGATPFRDDGAAMDDVDGPGDETYPKSFALEPEGDDSMPVQETGGQASAGPESYQDSQDPPQSLEKIEKESAGYAVSEIPDVPCASRFGPTPVFPNPIRAGPHATPDQIRPLGDGSSDVGMVGMATRV